MEKASGRGGENGAGDTTLHQDLGVVIVLPGDQDLDVVIMIPASGPGCCYNAPW